MWDSERKTVVEIAHQMVACKLVTGTSGNISIRLQDDDAREIIAVTPSGVHYDVLGAADIVIVDSDGKTVEGKLKPSIETLLHLAIYSRREKVNAVVHTHSLYASILAVSGITMPPILDDQAVYLGGEIGVSQYSLPGTKEMAVSVVAALGNKNAVIMANHGALCVGRNIREAFDNCLLLERIAQIYINALILKKVKELPVNALQKELDLFNMNNGDVDKKER